MEKSIISPLPITENCRKDNNGIHNPICEVCCDPVGLVKDIKCSCGERFYIDYM